MMIKMDFENLLYEGKAKSVYQGESENEVIVKFRDDMTAGDGARKESMGQKGYFNSIISSKIFETLEEAGVKTQLIELVEPCVMKAQKLEMIPIEVIVRNIATGSIVRKFPFEEKAPFNPPLIQMDFKSDEFHDPTLNDAIAIALGIASKEELDEIRDLALKVNDIMSAMFKDAGIILVDFKIEFGKDAEGNIVLGDEISPDSCRLWDAETLDMLDKELFRQGKDDEVINAYEEVFNRIITDEDKAKWNL